MENLVNKNLILVSGAVRSGKSQFAEDLFKDSCHVTYIATFLNLTSDKSWSERIKKHKSRRPDSWALVENFSDLNHEINLLSNNSDIIIDSLGGIVYSYLDMKDREWQIFSNDFIKTLTSFHGRIVLVIEEVGWSITSSNKESNLFVDRMGELSHALNKISSKSYLLIHGKALNLNRLSESNE